MLFTDAHRISSSHAADPVLSSRLFGVSLCDTQCRNSHQRACLARDLQAAPESRSMSYIRLTMATPPEARVAEIRQQYEQLLSYLAQQPGFLTGWVVAGHGEGEIGRLSVWDSEAAANRAATDSYVLALHA